MVVFILGLHMVVYMFLCYTGIKTRGGIAMESKPRKITEAQKRAHQNYMEKFVEVKVRMTPERRAEIQAHAKEMGESATAFINRAKIGRASCRERV